MIDIHRLLELEGLLIDDENDPDGLYPEFRHLIRHVCIQLHAARAIIDWCRADVPYDLLSAYDEIIKGEST